MTPYVSRSIFALGGLVLLVGRVRAEEAPLGGTLVVVERDDRDAKRRRRALEQPAFVTIVEGGASAPGEPPPVAEALARVAGASVRSLGGLGSFASVSVRGAPAGQTEILLDGVPLSRLGSAALDVGQLDLATFDEVEVWRGSVPVELGGATLGGAINFVTGLGPAADGARTRVALGVGSFGARRVRVVRRDAVTLFGAPLATNVAASYAGATGDFTFHHDGGTPVEPSDDHTATRMNDGYDQLDAAARARLGGPRRTLEVGQRVLARTQGVPGPATAAAADTSLGTLRSITDARARIGDVRARGEVAGYLVVERQRWEDPMGEVGLSAQDRSFATTAGGLAVRGRARVPMAPGEVGVVVSGAADGRVERFTERDERGDQDGARGGREGLAGAVAAEIALGPLTAIPGLRVDRLETHGDSAAGAMMSTAPAARTDVAWTPRLGLTWRVAPAVALKASVGEAFRAPTVVELFGDRGVVVGTPDLAPETGTTQDVGVVIAPDATDTFDHVLVEWAVFRAEMDDLIGYLPTSAGTLRALNLGGARLAGHELAAGARFARRVSLTGAYSFLDTAQESAQISADGHPLPGRPRHELYARAEVALRPRGRSLALWADATLASGNTLDVAGRAEVPARRLVGAGVRWSPRDHLALTLEGRNLTDARKDDIALASAPRPGVTSVPRPLSDVLGYPLPGRAVTLTLDLTY